MTEPVTDRYVDSPDIGVPLEDSDSDDQRDTILLSVGCSDEHRVESLASTAAEVGGLMQTTVSILHVFTRPRFERVVEQLDYSCDREPSPDEVAKRLKPVRTVAQRLSTPLRDYGSTMEITGRVGETVSGEIVAAAEDIDATRVLVGGRRRTPAGKVKTGSTAQEVLLKAPCPVTFVRDTE